MDLSNHTLNSLFQQLGLPDSQEAIEEFIEKNKGLDKSIHLWEADFWTPSQAAFIHESLEEDSDWTEVIDHLDALLRG
jgi:hypothetical protein